MTGNGGYQDWNQQGPHSGPPPGPAYDWAAQDSRPSGGGPGLGAGIALAVGAVVLLVAVLLVVLVIQFRGSGDGGPVAGGEMVTVTSTAPAGTATSGSSTSRSTTSTSRTTTTTRAPEPGGLVEECSDSGGSELPRAGRGTEATSCPFAISVRDAYFDTARPGDPALVEAYSPVTGQRYEMRCTGGEVITCRGGNNAVVYLY